jgi:hypothetical protein
MSYAQSVTIGPRFFRKAFNDYSDKFWAFAREVMQNSIDCGSTAVTVNVTGGEGVTRVDVDNNGAPMDRDTLVNKLLSLGESGKDFQNAVGGFGKAKEILYFAHKEYVVRSGFWEVHGSGAGYDLVERDHPHTGTTSTVWWEGDCADALRAAFRRFIQLCGTGKRVTFTLDGEQVRPEIAGLTVARTLDHDGEPWAEVRLGKAPKGLVVARVGGVPMFSTNVDYKGVIALELLGTSSQRLTSNRDALRYPFGNHLSDFVTTVAVDKRTAFLLEKAEYRRIEGRKLRRPRPAQPVTPREAGETIDRVTAALADTPEPTGGAGIIVEALARTDAPRPGLLGHEFVVKNCVRKPVPPEYDPESLKFSDYSHWCVRAWAGCLLALHDLNEVDEEFSVGFVFSDAVVAESERGDYGQVYYLNPCRVSKRGHARRFTKSVRHRVVAAAAHEFVHGALGESYHGEDFAGKLTGVMALVMKHGRRFNKSLG